jgi:predicted O-methyltransferase YrrM
MNIEKIIKIDKYISDLFTKEDKILISTKEAIKEANMPQHSIFPNQGKFLQLLALLCKAEKILEIGTLGGYSSIFLARSLPPQGKLITIEINQEYATVAKSNIENANLSDKVNIIIGDAIAVLNKLDNQGIGKFDIFFFDAYKPSYIEYFEWAISHSHPGSIIIADNVIRDGKVICKDNNDEKVTGVRKYNEMLSKRIDVISTIIPNISGNGYDGMAVSIVK